MHLRRHDTIDVDDRKGWKHNGLRGVEGANVCIGDLALFGELAALAAWVRNYAARGARGCNVRKGYFARIGGARMGGEGSTSYSLAVCDTIKYSVTNRQGVPGHTMGPLGESLLLAWALRMTIWLVQWVFQAILLINSAVCDTNYN